MAGPKPPTVYTPDSFLDSEYKRVETSWFYKALITHIEMQYRQHTDLALANAGGAETNLRVAAAMASAFKTVLDLPTLIREGKITIPGQIVGKPPSRTKPDANDPSGDEDHAETR